MQIHRKFRDLLAILILYVGLLNGTAARPQEIEELLQSMNQPKLAHTIKQEKDHDDP